MEFINKKSHLILIGLWIMGSILTVKSLGLLYGTIAVVIGGLLAYSTYTDLQDKIIPDKSTALVLILGLLSIYFNLDNALVHLIACALTAVVLIGAHIVSGKQIGLGDVKLLTVLSLYLGPNGIMSLLFISTLLAGLFG